MDQRKVISAALDAEVTTWRERQIDAINQEAFPLLDEEDEAFLKTATALNTAWGATKVLLPPVGTLAGQAAIPLFILGQAQSGMVNAYKHHLKKINAQMSLAYTAVRDRLVNIIQGIARTFTATPAATALIDMISAAGPVPFAADEDRKLKAFYREMLHRAGTIVTDPATIRAQTRNGFGTLLENIKKIHVATYRHNPWFCSHNRHRLFYSRGGGRLVRTDRWKDYWTPAAIPTSAWKQWSAEWRRKGATHLSTGWVMLGGKFERAKRNEVHDEILSQAWQMDVAMKRRTHGHVDILVARRTDHDASRPPPFTQPTAPALSWAYNLATIEMRSQGVL